MKEITNDTLSKFFAAVWGDRAGSRILTVKRGADDMRTLGRYDTNEEAERAARQAIADGLDCYYSPHLFSGGRRLAVDSLGCGAFYLDIDIRPDKAGCYDSAESALAAVKSFVAATGLSEPTVIDSGGGFHLYWFLDDAIPPDQWSESARTLKTLCRAQGLKADASVTSDAARVLRVPESRNYKSGDDGKPVKLLTEIKPVSFDSLPISRPPAFPADQSTLINDSFLAGIETASDDAKRIARMCLKHLSRERCVDYSGWIDAGNALWRVFEGSDEGFDLWNEWSRSAASYSQKACREKWDTFGGDRVESVGVGSLVHWAKQDSPEAFIAEWESYNAANRAERLASRAGEIQLTDAGNAARLIALHGDDIRYDTPRRMWLVWTGTHWKENADAEIRQLAEQTVKSMYAEAAKTADDARRTALVKHATRSESAPSLRAMVELAWSKPGIQAGVRDFDAFPQMLNVANGVIDLRSGVLYPHAREFMQTGFVPIAYDAAATCPVFERFLSRIFAGNADLISYLRRAVGYTLTGETSEQVAFICHGSGANGKSTLLEIIHKLLGGLAGSIRTEALMQQRFVGSAGHSEDIASLLGARFVSVSETEAGHRLAEHTVKQLTGGDTITASRKYGRAFTFVPTFKLWFAVNHLPSISGSDEGIWRRLRRIPFDQFIPEQERDAGLKDKLHAELSGILNWAVRGAVEWYGCGLGKAADVESATHAYRAEQDTVERFLSECCETGDAGFSVAPSLLHENYQQWCLESGVEPLNKLQFPTELGSVDICNKLNGCQ